MSDDVFDEKTLALAEEQAKRHGFATVEDYVRALLIKDQASGTLEQRQAYHARMRAMTEEGRKSDGAN